MIKKLRWFFYYKKIIKQNKNYLLKTHGIKVDWVYRMYKTYTLSLSEIDDVNSYGIKHIDNILDKEKSRIEETFINLKLYQFIGLMELEFLNDKQIAMAFRYKYFDTAKIFNYIIWMMLSLTSMGVGWLINNDYSSIIFGLLTVITLFLISRVFVVSRLD